MTAVEASFALQVVKWLDARERARGRGARHCLRRVPSSKQVRDEVLRRVKAIREHRERYGAPDDGRPDNPSSARN